MVSTYFEQPSSENGTVWPSKGYLLGQRLGTILAGVKCEVLRFWIGNKLSRAPEVPPGYKQFETLKTRVLLDWLDVHICQNTQFRRAQTVLIMTENRELDSQLSYLKHTLSKLLARTAIHRREQWHIVFVPLTRVTGLD
jgi:hypothetical protein